MKRTPNRNVRKHGNKQGSPTLVKMADKEQKMIEELAKQNAEKEFKKRKAEEKDFHEKWYAKPDGGHWDETRDYIDEWGKFNGYKRNEPKDIVDRFYAAGRMHPQAGPSKRAPPPGASKCLYPKINGGLIGKTASSTTAQESWNMAMPHDGKSTMIF